MHKQHVMTALRWVRRKDPEGANEMMLYRMFTQAFAEHYQAINDEAHARILCDLDDFELYGSIPLYVSRFIRRTCAKFVFQQPQREGEPQCFVQH